jgi:hypothetical protein
MVYYLAVGANYNSLSPNRQDGEVVARRVHNSKVVSSSPITANFILQSNVLG